MQKYAFIFDDVRLSPDRQIGRHAHRQWELSHIVKGRGTRNIGDNTEPMKEGEVILIPPYIPHVWQFDPTYTDEDGCISNITVFFEPELPVTMATIFPEFQCIANRLIRHSEALSYTGKSREAIASLLYSMRGKNAESRLPEMIKLLAIISDPHGSCIVGRNCTLSRAEQRIERIRTYCACNFANNISLGEIAAYAGMNKSAFCTFIKRNIGKTFSEYMNEFRLAHSLERIKNTNDPISEIAYSVGFSNVTYFNRLFKHKYDCTPKSMRYSKEQ